MDETYKSLLLKNSKSLRTQMTPEERHLWYDFLKKLPFTVHRQKVLYRYIVDFYVANKKIVIELDGYQHGEETNRILDEERDTFLSSNGYTILRYTNEQIHSNFEGVCKDILLHLELTDLL